MILAMAKNRIGRNQSYLFNKDTRTRSYIVFRRPIKKIPKVATFSTVDRHCAKPIMILCGCWCINMYLQNEPKMMINVTVVVYATLFLDYFSSPQTLKSMGVLQT